MECPTPVSCTVRGPRMPVNLQAPGARPLLVMVLLCASLQDVAQAQCASVPPVTGLGACIDSVAAQSSRMVGQINRLGYRLHYGPGSYTDHELKRIYIQTYSCSQAENFGIHARVSILAHELGHAEYGVQQDTRSRAAYIQSWCDAEGHAVLNNIHARAEALQCSRKLVDIGVAASNASELLKMHAARGNDRRRIGEAFCAVNSTSTTGQNYRDYYGAYYDAHY